MPVEVARRLLPSDVFIGWSVETMADVAQSARLPLDYLGVSPVFASPTKTDTSTPWGLDGLRQVRTATALPLVAIGGIHHSNAHQVLQAGADGLAVVSALCAAESPARSAAEFVKILKM
jgi:thiamine-phosphate pyrophosphorylase